MSRKKNEEIGLPSQLDPVAEVLSAIGQGHCVLVVDDERRENEGDLICAADRVTPSLINFMAVQGKGLICLALGPQQVEKLGLSRMGRRGRNDRYDTAFLESVDAAQGISTGISAADRSLTIRACIDAEASPGSLRVPGHVFPLEAMDGGVLSRPGHTEAAVDLARLAGCHPSGVICEVMRDDGEMARLPELLAMARKFDLKVTSVADIVAYRHATELLVHCEEEVDLPTRFGSFRLRIYTNAIDDASHLALVKGQPQNQDAPLVRVHSECFTGDVLGSLRCDCGEQLADSMQRIEEEGHGVVLYMRQEGRGIGLPSKIKAYALQDQGMDTVEANEHLGLPADLRDYALSAQILSDLGVHQCRLLTNNPAKVQGLNQSGIEVLERVPVKGIPNPHNERYLETKKTRMGHLL